MKNAPHAGRLGETTVMVLEVLVKDLQIFFSSFQSGWVFPEDPISANPAGLQNIHDNKEIVNEGESKGGRIIFLPIFFSTNIKWQHP